MLFRIYFFHLIDDKGEKHSINFKFSFLIIVILVISENLPIIFFLKYISVKKLRINQGTRKY